MFGWTHDDIRDCFVALVISMGVGLIGALIMVSQVSNTSIKELIPLDLPSQRVRVSWQGSISDSKTQVFGPSEETKRQLDIVLDLVADAGSKGVLYEGRVDSLTIYNPDGLLFFRFSRPASYEYAYQFGPQVSDADRLACLKACCVDLEDSHSLNDSSIFSEPIQVYVTH
ncbi:MAG: hypothetical protein KDK78_07900, partial [Chlamydiia bacterium]|nr:hypothetical protein [Chlamydiia bacterium]